MKDRFKEARKAKKFTQAQLADAMHISKSAIEAYEYGRSDITDRVASDFCRILGVNEDWLRTGSGEMFAPKDRETEIAELVAKIYKDDDPFRRSLIRMISDMNEDQIALLKEMAYKLVEDMNKENLSE